ncbi:hypothetical protein GY45DRAFT_83733 [Cubamyces sp. BRFM 1775]|nr:hypothetical protein GY45DRAFT_83733 [Cubamyces sp. BRFM 1775]
MYPLICTLNYLLVSLNTRRKCRHPRLSLLASYVTALLLLPTRSLCFHTCYFYYSLPEALVCSSCPCCSYHLLLLLSFRSIILPILKRSLIHLVGREYLPLLGMTS